MISRASITINSKTTSCPLRMLLALISRSLYRASRFLVGSSEIRRDGMASPNLPLRLATALRTHLSRLVLAPCLSTVRKRRVLKLLPLLFPRGSVHPRVALLVGRRNSSVIDAFLAHRVWPRVASVFGKGESFNPLFFFVTSADEFRNNFFSIVQGRYSSIHQRRTRSTECERAAGPGESC